MTDRKKPGVAFWATVGLVVVLAYPLSMGPVAWFYYGEATPPTWVLWFYWPVEFAYEHGSMPMRDAIDWYVRVWRKL